MLEISLLLTEFRISVGNEILHVQRTTHNAVMPFYKLTGRFKSKLGLLFGPEEQGNVFPRTTQRYNPKDLVPHSHRCENLKSNVFILISCNGIKLDTDFLRELGQLSRYSDGLGDPGSIPGRAKFSLPRSVQTGSGALSMDTRAISLGEKMSGREADHSPPSSAEVKNGGAIPPLPHTPS
jgi:hypothetical protein